MLLVPRRRLRSATPAARRLVLGLRALIVGAIVLALAEPVMYPPGRARAVVFAVDVSDSMSPQQRAWAHTWASRAAASLPPSVMAVMEADRSGGSFSPLRNALLGEWELQTGHAVSGSKTLTLSLE